MAIPSSETDSIVTSPPLNYSLPFRPTTTNPECPCSYLRETDTRQLYSLAVSDGPLPRVPKSVRVY
jgi:hypothetical protein